MTGKGNSMPESDDLVSGDWIEWKQHVLEELKRLSKSSESMGSCLGKIKVDVAKLKIRAGLWGALAGSLPVIAVFVILLLTGRIP